jgi:ubiquinone/menaquinone biosynthesis C-methylase UbiE
MTSHGMAKAAVQQRVQRAYAAPTWWYDFRGFFILLFAHRTSLGSLVRFFERNIGSRHLEVPVGSGTLFWLSLLWRRLRNRRAEPPSIVGVDCSETMVEGSRRLFGNRRDTRLLVGDVTRLDFPNDHFESINVPNGIHCFPDDAAAMRELYRVLEPGRILAANVVLHPRGPRWLRAITAWIYRVSIEKGLLVKPYAIREIQALVRKAGFEIDADFVNGNTYHFLARKPSTAR